MEFHDLNIVASVGGESKNWLGRISGLKAN